MNLPKPDCAVRPSDCADIDVINTLDGFNLQPRLSIPFSGDIDVSTVSSQTVFSSGWAITDTAAAIPSGSIRSCGIRRPTRFTRSPTSSSTSTRATSWW
jgi:hypothetical protein